VEGLAQPSTAFRVVPGLGVHFATRFFPRSAVQPFADFRVAWLFRAAAPAFQVGTQEVLIPPSLVLGLTVGIGIPF